MESILNIIHQGLLFHVLNFLHSSQNRGVWWRRLIELIEEYNILFVGKI